MKKLLFTTLIFLNVSLFSYAQTSFSCTHRSICTWNDVTKKYDNCSGYDENSLFAMNKAETMFTHTIESLTSTYYVKSKKYDEDDRVWEYTVTSDVGNQYLYIFDPKNYQVRAVYTRDNETKMVVFTVKSVF